MFICKLIRFHASRQKHAKEERRDCTISTLPTYLYTHITVETRVLIYLHSHEMSTSMRVTSFYGVAQFIDFFSFYQSERVLSI